MSMMTQGHMYNPGWNMHIYIQTWQSIHICATPQTWHLLPCVLQTWYREDDNICWANLRKHTLKRFADWKVIQFLQRLKWASSGFLWALRGREGRPRRLKTRKHMFVVCFCFYVWKHSFLCVFYRCPKADTSENMYLCVLLCFLSMRLDRAA